MKTIQQYAHNFTFAAIMVCSLFAHTATAAQTQTAQRTSADREHIFGASGMISFPYGEFNDSYDQGFGLHAMLDYPWISILDITADIGYNRFAGDGDRESITVMEYSIGTKLVFGWFFMGGETGYYSYVEDFSFVPIWGLKFGQFEFSMRTKAVGGGSWSGMRLGWYF